VVTQTRGDILVEGFEWGVLNAFLNLFCRVTGGSRWGYRESDSTVWVEEEGRVERRVVEHLEISVLTRIRDQCIQARCTVGGSTPSVYYRGAPYSNKVNS